MSAYTGEIELLEIEDTVGSGTYNKVSGEVSVSFSISNDTVEKGAKDSPKFKGYIKTLMEGNITVTVEGRLTQTGTDLGFTDISTLALENGTDTNKGERLMRITTATVGGHTISFTGLVLNPDVTFARAEKVDYTFEVKPSGTITIVEVAA